MKRTVVRQGEGKRRPREAAGIRALIREFSVRRTNGQSMGMGIRRMGRSTEYFGLETKRGRGKWGEGNLRDLLDQFGLVVFC